MRSIHWIFITANGHEIDFAGRNTGFPGFAFHRLSGPTRFVARSSPCSARASRTLEIQVDPNPWISRVQKSTNEHRVLPWRVFSCQNWGTKNNICPANWSCQMDLTSWPLQPPFWLDRVHGRVVVSNFEAARFEPAIGWVGWYFLKFLCHKIGLFKRWWDAIVTLMRW